MATKKELIAKAKELEIQVPSDATKAEIETLIANHLEASTKEDVEQKDQETKEKITSDVDNAETKEDNASEDNSAQPTPKPTTEETSSENDVNNVIVNEAVVVKELPAGVFKSDNGNLYKFIDRTPKTLVVEDKKYTINELLYDTETMEDLIASKCIFIQKL